MKRTYQVYGKILKVFWDGEDQVAPQLNSQIHTQVNKQNHQKLWQILKMFITQRKLPKSEKYCQKKRPNRKLTEAYE